MGHLDMSGELWVSIIVCSCNRAASLKNTLEAFDRLRFPSEWRVELVVVDNGSTDDTEIVVRNATLSNMEVRYLCEPRKGKSHALNTGLATARGDYILFTDDDVLPSEEWVEQMVAHLLKGRCDAVTGQVILASHLLRPWMTSMHKKWLALSLDSQSRDWSREMIGANMGFRRSVLERVCKFEPELGPGPEGLGFCEDTFFGWELVEAGFKIEYVPQAVVRHQLDVSRLRRSNWLSDARNRGRTQAYLLYHWEHADLKAPGIKWLWYWVKLRLRSILQRPPPLESEGCPAWEMSYVAAMARCNQFRLERRRPRNYARHGLSKRLRPENVVKGNAEAGQGGGDDVTARETVSRKMDLGRDAASHLGSG